MTENVARLRSSFHSMVTPGLRFVNNPARRHTVCMVHGGRSGSTVTANFLRSHDRINWAGEWVGRHGRRRIKAEMPQSLHISDLAYRLWKRRTQVVGFEMKPGHTRHLIRTEFGADFLSAVVDLGVDSFIVLERKNYLRRLVSQLQNIRSASRHVTEPSESVIRISIDVRQVPSRIGPVPLLSSFELYQSDMEMTRAFAESRPGVRLLNLSYESDISTDPYQGYVRICQFVNVEPGPRKSPTLARKNPFELPE